MAQRFSQGPTEDHSTLGSRQLWEAEGGGPRIPRRDRKTSQGSSEEKREEWGAVGLRSYWKDRERL